MTPVVAVVTLAASALGIGYMVGRFVHGKVVECLLFELERAEKRVASLEMVVEWYAQRSES